MKLLYSAVEQEEGKIETSIIEKEEEIHLLIYNRVSMKNVLIHSLIFHRDWLNTRIVWSFVGEREWQGMRSRF